MNLSPLKNNQANKHECHEHDSHHTKMFQLHIKFETWTENFVGKWEQTILLSYIPVALHDGEHHFNQYQ